MKKLSRYGGIIVIICSLVMYLAMGKGYENNEPVQVTGGIMVDGKFKEVYSGGMGGSLENQETFSTMQSFSLAFMGLGGLMFLMSFVFSDEEKSPYM